MHEKCYTQLIANEIDLEDNHLVLPSCPICNQAYSLRIKSSFQFHLMRALSFASVSYFCSTLVIIFVFAVFVIIYFLFFLEEFESGNFTLLGLFLFLFVVYIINQVYYGLRANVFSWIKVNSNVSISST